MTELIPSDSSPLQSIGDNELSQLSGDRMDDGGKHVRNFAVYKLLGTQLEHPEDPQNVKAVLLGWEAAKLPDKTFPTLTEATAQTLIDQVQIITGSKDFIDAVLGSLQEGADDNRKKWPSIAKGKDAEIRKIRSTLKKRDYRQVHGLLRQTDTCIAQTEVILNRLQPFMAESGVVVKPAWGLTAQTVFHQILVATPNLDTYKHLQALAQTLEKKHIVNAALSLDTMRHADGPRLADLTVLDPTLLQMYEMNDDLAKLSPDQAIDHLISVAPGMVTESGIFIGPWVDYVSIVTAIDEDHEGEAEFTFPDS